MEKKISTWLSQLACLGVKTNRQRGCAASQSVDLLRGAGGEVVADRDHLLAGGDLRLELLEETEQVETVARLGGHRAHLARVHPQRCEQVLRAVTDVLVLAPSGPCGPCRRIRPRRRLRLDAGLLVDRDDQCPLRRIEVEPAYLRACASKSGPSSLITHCSSRCGLISAARRISCACDSDMPTRSASSRCVQRSRRSPSGVSPGRVQAIAINRARVCGPCTSGRPGRGASRRPAIPSASKRRRHFFTVCSEQPTSFAILAAERPSAAASTIRARSTARRSAVRERVIRSSSRRSSTPILICFAGAAISIASIVAHKDDDLFDREPLDPATGNELTGATTRCRGSAGSRS